VGPFKAVVIAMSDAKNAPILTWEELFRQRDLWKKQALKSSSRMAYSICCTVDI